MAVIFVKIRNDEGEIYRSYHDFWRLVDLSGFDKCELSEVDKDSDNIYIFSPVNGNTINYINTPHKARFIAWQLERPNNGDENKEGIDRHGIEEMWFYDRAICKRDGLKYVIIGGHPDLGGEKTECQYDMMNMCYLYGKRTRQCNKLIQRGLSLSPNSYDLKERDIELASSRYGLCLHQDDEPVIEPLRFVLFACWKLPLIVEYSHDYHPYLIQGWDKDIDNEVAILQAEYNYRLMTEVHTFRRCVEDAL